MKTSPYLRNAAVLVTS